VHESTAPDPPPTIESLRELALDLRWSWNHHGDTLWDQLDPELWAATHNPWVVLQTVARGKLNAYLSQPEFRRLVAKHIEFRRRHLAAKSWFQQHHGQSGLTRVAYFSLEFALSEALPIYSGGLGNVAADQLKAACDLGVPVTGVGLLYQQGYFRQVIQGDGTQQALFPYNDPGQLPITPVRDAAGEWLRVKLQLAGCTIRLRAWQVQAGRRTLYLLDSNDPANPPATRVITSELYGGGPDLRLQQEMVLGIGGWRLLRALHLEPDVCHLNEGHAALAVLERARSFAEDNACEFDVAVAATRAGNLFTTHTPIPAGFDRFAPELIERYLRSYAENELGIRVGDFLSLGRRDADDPGEAFNMAWLAARGSAAINGVSQLHGAVSRRLFGPLFPRWPESEVPVAHVTNGVHVPTWDSAPADALWTEACGCERCRGTMESAGQDLRCVCDENLWTLRTANRKALVEYVSERGPGDGVLTGLAGQGPPAPVLDPDTLTLGFARRFAAYKRPTLLLQSPERLLRILADRERPVQLIIAGKAHPADHVGQTLLADWIHFIRRPGVEGRVVFLPDYDLQVAARLVQGVDLWVNTPQRPHEASGTSGMKILVNGGLNLSVLDGWWAEAFAPDVGWAIGDGREHEDDRARDATDAEALYTLLEQEIVPAFYTRDERGIPMGWVARMRESMARLTPQFSTNRVVREYTERYYIPFATDYRTRAANGGAWAARLVAWKRHLSTHWHEAHIGDVRVGTHAGRHVFSVDVRLGHIDPDAIRVELFAEPVGGGEPVRQAMTRGPALAGSERAFEYRARVCSTRPAHDFTPRLVPQFAGARVPLEAAHILWQR
jgi:starch phosphorylase